MCFVTAAAALGRDRTAVLNVFRQGYQCARCHQASHTACLEAAGKLPCCPPTPPAPAAQESPAAQEDAVVVAAEVETDASQPPQEAQEGATGSPSAQESGPSEGAWDVEMLQLQHENSGTPQAEEVPQETKGTDDDTKTEPESTQEEKHEVPQTPEGPQEQKGADGDTKTEPPNAQQEKQETAQTPEGPEGPQEPERDAAEGEREPPAEPPKALMCSRSESPADTDPEQTRVRYHALAVKELIETEQQYYGDLLVIDSVFKVPLETNPQLTQLVTKEDFKNIFSNFEVFQQLHSELLVFAKQPSPPLFSQHTLDAATCFF